MTLAACFSKNPKWITRAEEMLQSVLSEEPDHPAALKLLKEIRGDKGLSDPRNRGSGGDGPTSPPAAAAAFVAALKRYGFSKPDGGTEGEDADDE